MNETIKKIENLKYNKTDNWNKIEELLKKEVNKATTIKELMEIIDALIDTIGTKQSDLISATKKLKDKELEFEYYKKDNEVRYIDIKRFKELLAMEQLKNKALIDEMLKIKKEI